MEITREVILKAYKKTGLKPVPGYYTTYEDKKLTGACLVGVLFLQDHGIENRICIGDIEKWIKKNMSVPQINSLISGFDGTKKPIMCDIESYNLGKELRKELVV